MMSVLFVLVALAAAFATWTILSVLMDGRKDDNDDSGQKEDEE